MALPFEPVEVATYPHYGDGNDVNVHDMTEISVVATYPHYGDGNWHLKTRVFAVMVTIYPHYGDGN